MMTGLGRLDPVRVGLIAAAGVSLGFGLSESRQASLVAIALLIVMAGAGEWLEVQLGRLGSITLRPVFAFASLWTSGPGVFVLVGLVPLLLVASLRKTHPPLESLAIAGGDALCFWAGFLVYLGLSGSLAGVGGGSGVAEIAARFAGFAAFWAVQIPLQAVRLVQTEGIRFGVILRHLAQRVTPHVLVLSMAVVSLSYISESYGLLIMAMAAVALVEAYYPWKLLGEQGGVLLTSLQMMAQAVDLKDPYTSNHSQRVSRHAVRIARALGLPEDEVERIRIGALMHDIGKIGISGRIIRKPSKLTPEERDLMMHHSSVSADIIEHLEILGESADMVRHHHEHCDGSGYPDGLKGEEIPLGSRIILVADAYDALTTDRPYRKGASRAETVDVIRRHAGTQFDATVVAVLERISPLL